MTNSHGQRNRAQWCGRAGGALGAAGGLPVQERPRAGAVVGRPCAAGANNSWNLVAIHGHLRGELRQTRRAPQDIAAGVVRGARTASWRSAGRAAELPDLLLSHLGYEEDELQQFLGMLTGPIQPAACRNIRGGDPAGSVSCCPGRRIGASESPPPGNRRCHHRTPRSDCRPRNSSGGP